MLEMRVPRRAGAAEQLGSLLGRRERGGLEKRDLQWRGSWGREGCAVQRVLAFPTSRKLLRQRDGGQRAPKLGTGSFASSLGFWCGNWGKSLWGPGGAFRRVFCPVLCSPRGEVAPGGAEAGVSTH